jgi:hypothetical protein
MGVVRRFAVVSLACAMLAGVAAAEPVASSLGRWSGSVAERSPGWPAGEAGVKLTVEGSAERFSVDLAGPGGPLLSGEFQTGKGKSKDVFGPPAAKGLLSFLGRGSAINPLEGKPLAWARRAGGDLIVYRLDLRGGAHRLDRLVLSPAGDRMGVAFERREHDRLTQSFSASLARSAP